MLPLSLAEYLQPNQLHRYHKQSDSNEMNNAIDVFLAAHRILDIFKNPRTPHHFVILSGDVHYSFTYDVRLRRNKEDPLIWQITSSGVMSTFPPRLLRVFDRLNRFLFAGYSPLNWFTRRPTQLRQSTQQTLLIA